MAKWTEEILKDEITPKEVRIKMVIGSNGDGIDISADGYGTFTNQNILVTLEVFDGELQLLIWDDINKEDPRRISLESTSLDKRECYQ